MKVKGKKVRLETSLVYGRRGQKAAATVDKLAGMFYRYDHHDLAEVQTALMRALWHAYGVAHAKGYVIFTEVLNDPGLEPPGGFEP